MTVLEKRSFQTMTMLILIFLLILLISKTSFIFNPLFTYMGAVALPIIGAGILFYLTRPLVDLLEKYKINRIVSILIVFLLLILVLFLIVTYVAPVLQRQFTNLVHNIPRMVAGIQDLISYWQDNQNLIPERVNETIDEFTSNLQSYIQSFMGFIFGFISEFIGFMFSIVLIPFFLFFMLKDGEKFAPFITQFFEAKKAANIRSLLQKINETLTSYIQGQLIVSVCIGILLYIGYSIIHLDYALTLAIFGMVISVIPFLGPYLAVMPALIVGFFQDPMMAVWVAIVMIIAQQIEGNLVSPNVMGRALHLHPLTVITVILAAGSIAGLLGMLFAVPLYAVVKTIISHFYGSYQDSKPNEEDALI
ncbi:AI-2E family transporter [Lentibacillus cibarius]|uniref:AI-2E family transporter n=1 Tax=Lentibacillus cibarius TaxID=2583219 RepID=UPI002D77EA3E|nr:AI-2E family transporter [Lentibacillus cibarius]